MFETLKFIGFLINRFHATLCILANSERKVRITDLNYQQKNPVIFVFCEFGRICNKL